MMKVFKVNITYYLCDKNAVFEFIQFVLSFWFISFCNNPLEPTTSIFAETEASASAAAESTENSSMHIQNMSVNTDPLDDTMVQG